MAHKGENRVQTECSCGSITDLQRLQLGMIVFLSAWKTSNINRELALSRQHVGTINHFAVSDAASLRLHELSRRTRSRALGEPVQALCGKGGVIRRMLPTGADLRSTPISQGKTGLQVIMSRMDIIYSEKPIRSQCVWISLGSAVALLYMAGRLVVVALGSPHLQLVCNMYK